MDATKLRLSEKEMELVSNADLILTKNLIIQKVMHLLGLVQAQQHHYLQSFSSQLTEDVFLTPAKISKGENYRGLPYLILDQPRFFNKENVFAIRHLFWWGNFFSSTLHLSGSPKKLYEEKIINSFESLSKEDFYICINMDQWQHHFDESNFMPVYKLTVTDFGKTIRNNSFIKLSKKILFEKWNKMEENFLEIFHQYISMLAD